MEKVNIKKPDQYHFKTEIPVRISDLNYGNHLGNDSVLSICHEARVRFLNHLGFSEMDVDGKGTIMTDAALKYKSEGFYGDVLTIQITVTGISKVGCDFFYLLKNKHNEKEIAVVKTGIVFYDYKNKKVVSVPEKFIADVKKLKHNN